LLSQAAKQTNKKQQINPQVKCKQQIISHVVNQKVIKVPMGAIDEFEVKKYFISRH
jgi:hypothetical protein